MKLTEYESEIIQQSLEDAISGWREELGMDAQLDEILHRQISTAENIIQRISEEE